MKWDSIGGCFVAESADWCKGWEVIGVIRFKPGVQLVAVRRSVKMALTMKMEEQMRTVYVPDELTPWHEIIKEYK